MYFTIGWSRANHSQKNLRDLNAEAEEPAKTIDRNFEGLGGMRWNISKIGEAPIQIIDGDRGKNYPKQSDFLDAGHCLFLNTSNVTNNGFDFSSCQFVTEEKDQMLRKGKLSRNDLVMTTRGTIGNVAFYNGQIPYENIRINSGMVIFRPNNSEILPQFLYQYFRSPFFKGQTNSMRSGSAQPQLPIRDINCINIPIPPVDEQKRIASILSAYDDLIENNRRRIALLEESARLLYKEWFVHFRFPGHEHVRIVNGVPEGWETFNVPEIIEINPKEYVEKSKEIWYVPMACLSESGMTIDVRDFEKRTTHTCTKFKNGDVLFPRITPCLENGKTGLVQFIESDEVACGSTEFIVLRGRKVSSEFTYCLSRTFDFRENAIKSMVGSSGRQRVQVSCFDDFAIALPPSLLLKQFDEVANANFSQIRNLTVQNQKLSQARDLLLPRLMNGELAV